MKARISYIAWACLYVLCTGLGVISDAAGFGKAMLVLVSVLFFLPGAYLVYDGQRRKDRRRLRTVRLICLISLGLTILLLIINILSVRASAAAGNVLFVLLQLVSTPMVCGQYWILSIFLWSCLLCGTFYRRKEQLSWQ